MAEHPVIAPKKLIEVALPLDEINKAAAREKSIRHGHPSTLHLWWARRPLAAARAVLFAQLVNDPSWKYSEAELKKPQVKSAITKKRNELFRLITDLVQWENTTNEDVLSRARAEIRASWRETCEANKKHPDAAKLFDPENLPPFHDPFAGGGTIPLEAQRLGLEAHATDLNPVAVLINKAMIEIPARFKEVPPCGPIPKAEHQTSARAVEDWSGAKGLAEDVRRCGLWIRQQAEQRIGHLYPKAKISKKLIEERPDLAGYEGQELTVIACIWCRTVRSPNPAFSNVEVPLASTFMLSTKEGKEAWIQPIVDSKRKRYRFMVHNGRPKDFEGAKSGTKVAKANFKCLLSNSPIPGDYIKSEAQAGRMGLRLMAVVAEGERGRVYLPPTDVLESAAEQIEIGWKPDVEFFQQALGFRIGNYGMSRWSDLFTPRQLVAMSTLCDLVGEARALLRDAARKRGMPDDGIPLASGGAGATAYADAISVYLGLAVSRTANTINALAIWSQSREQSVNLFSRQAIPMAWDFPEVNPFAGAAGDFGGTTTSLAKTLSHALVQPAFASQMDAQTQTVSISKIVSTDPPYYDNIGYADLSDFFYAWLRRALGRVLPDLFATISTPKSEELVATPARHGGKQAAEAFFLSGITGAMNRIVEQANPGFPVTIYYAFKQSETDNEEGTSSTGWDTFLEGLIRAGFTITGTWPMRTEREGGVRNNGRNSLASSIVLVCRRRGSTAGTLARKEFLRELDRALPFAIGEMTADPVAAIAPVDLAQACIGPGMGIFSRYGAVLEADGSPMSVRSALVHINKAVDNYFAEAEGDLDADTRFCIGWFQQYGFASGPFGEADVLARAKGTAVDGVKEAGVIDSGKGKVRLYKIKEYPKNWDPRTDNRTPIWEACHHMCRALGKSEADAGALLAQMQEKQDAIRQLAYRLYTICERQKWAEEARAYNELITSWPAIVEESRKAGVRGEQLELL